MSTTHFHPVNQALCNCPGCSSGFNQDQDVLGGTDPFDAKPTLTDAQIINQIDSGASWSGRSVIRYSFYTSADDTGGPEWAGFQEFTSYQKQQSREVMTLWDDLIQPSFLEETSSRTSAEINFANTSSGPSYAWGYYPSGSSKGGETWYNAQSYGGLYSPDYGDYEFMTILHEVGHALGLSHPGAYNGSGFNYESNAEYVRDTHQWTVMSYWSAGYTGGDWNGRYAQTPMVHDIMVIQAKYGADTTTRSGDTTYGFNSNAGHWVYNFASNSSPVLSIYDAGGIDTLDLSGFSRRAIIDLTPGRYSSAGGSSSTMTYNIGIALNTWIENARGGSGSDTIYGSEANNELYGNAGNDTFWAYGGTDLISGGSGTDHAYFTGSYATYTIDFGADFIIFGWGGSSDRIQNDVEFLVFTDRTIAFGDVSPPDRQVEGHGDVALWIKGGSFVAVLANGTEITLQTGSSGSWPVALGNLEGVAVEDQSGGYRFLFWNATDQRYWVIQTDGSGNATSFSSMPAGHVVFEEQEFQQDLDGDGQIGSPLVIESDGAVMLYELSGTYRLFHAAGGVNAIMMGGAAVGPATYAGLGIIAAEFDGAGGYNLMWQDTAGDYFMWTIDGNGNFVNSTVMIPSADIGGYEVLFGTDFNGNGTIDPAGNVIESSGDVTLVDLYGTYVMRLSSGGEIGISFGGAAVGRASYPDLSMIAAEASTGGYHVVWESASGDRFLWSLGADGTYTGNPPMDPMSVPVYEQLFNLDIDGDGTVSTLNHIETDGAVSLVAIGPVYRIGFSDGSTAGITMAGSPIGPNTYAGLEMVAAEWTGGVSYRLVWRTDDGDFIIWEVDSSGEFIGSSPLIAGGDIGYYEELFSTDLNGNGSIDPAGRVIESVGGITLCEMFGVYTLQHGDGSEVTITFGGAPVETTTFAGISMIAAEEYGAGYQVVWEDGSGNRFLWDLAANGAFVGNASTDPVSMALQEQRFGLDVDGDGAVATISQIENDGAVGLVEVGSVYRINFSDGSTGAITMGGSPVGPDTYAGLEMVAAEWTGGTSYRLMWRTTGGDYIMWEVGSNGEFLNSSSMIAGADVSGYELLFSTDFSGNGLIDPAGSVIETDGGVSLTDMFGVYTLQPTGGADIAISFGGSVVGPGTFPGLDMVAAEEGGGGYQVLWEDSSGSRFLWQLSATGAYVGNAPMDATSVALYEDRFDFDIDGDGTIDRPVVIETDGAVGLIQIGAAYRLSFSNGTTGAITMAGAPLGPDTWDELEMIAAEWTGGPFYSVMWEHDDGDYLMWVVNSDGEFAWSTAMIAEDDIGAYEALFGSDLDGNGTIGSMAGATIGYDLLDI